jgi:xanthine dehydrogenase small subunit
MGSAPASLEFVVNGRSVRVDLPVPGATLLDFLRAHGLTGAKEGCAEGECGACTVVLVAPHGDSSAFHPINSCLMLLPMAAGHEIVTVEALASSGRLADAQAAMAAAGGSQCGYCTPGFVMSLFAEQYRPGRQGPCDVHALAGNLCRCTGYRPIRDAALALGPAPADRFRARLAEPPPDLRTVQVDGFSRPTTVAACLDLLARDPSATIVAGGTDLGVEANLRSRRWTHLVSLEGIDELRELSEDAARVRIGAALPLSEMGRRWSGAPDAVSNWLALFAAPPIRNRATLGGNLATASPIGDAAPLLLALDASVRIARRGGTRSVPLSSFFTGYRRTCLAAGEIVTHVEIPKPFPALLRFYKIAKRMLDDISTLAAAMAIDLDADGRVRRARFAFGGMAATPIRLADAEAAIEGERWDRDAMARVQEIVGRTLTPISDHRGSKEYRLAVAQSLVARFHEERPR